MPAIAIGLVLSGAAFAVPIPKSNLLDRPAPRGGDHGNQPQAHAATDQGKADNDREGTEKTPLFIELKNSEEQRTEANKHATYEQEEATNDRLIAIFTIVLGVVGALELIILGLQIYWLRRTVTDSNKQHALTERAYVVPGTFNHEVSTDADRLRVALATQPGFATPFPSSLPSAELEVTYFAVQPVWSNMGNTPTISMRVRVDWGDNGERPVGSYRLPWQPFFIAPKSSENTEFIEMPGLNALIQGGAVGLSVLPQIERLIWGTAEYDDVFGKRHWLRWCYRIRPSRPVPGQGLRINFIQSGDYNASGEGAPSEADD